MMEEKRYAEGLKAYRFANYETAYELFLGIVESNDQNVKAWNALGVVCTKLGRIEDALICFENAYTIEPENSTYKKNLQNLQKKQLSSSSIKSKNNKSKISIEFLKNSKKTILISSISTGLIIAFIIFFHIFFSYAINAQTITSQKISNTTVTIESPINTPIFTAIPTSTGTISVSEMDQKPPIEDLNNLKKSFTVEKYPDFNKIFLFFKIYEGKNDYDYRFYKSIF
jgi:tetratricopeptide (TPR) repeat protein